MNITLTEITKETVFPFYKESPHLQKLLLYGKYGYFLGWFDGEHLRTSYCEIISDITHYAVL